MSIAVLSAGENETIVLFGVQSIDKYKEIMN